MSCTNATIGAGPRFCLSLTFYLLVVFGAEITSIHVNLVNNYNSFIGSLFLVTNTPFANFIDVSFCNMTVSYTHLGQKDNITIIA